MRQDVPALTDDRAELGASRRQLVADSFGLAVGAIGFGFVYGLAAREAGFSPIEAMAMSFIVYAGAAQFAAVGYVASGLAWPGIILLTALLNARHLLYSAALRPWLRDVPLPRRAVMAHLLTDESFALSISHFRRIGRTDERGYWLAAIGPDGIFTWVLATLAGVVLGAQIPEPGRLGIDVIFPAAMIGLAVGLITGRRELVAAIVGAGVAVGVALVTSPSIGIVAGGVVGPLVALLVPIQRDRSTGCSSPRTATPCPTPGRGGPAGDRPRGARTMSTNLILLAILMFAVTYPSRAVGLLTPGLDRLPKVAFDYLQLVGPAVLAALAAVSVVVVVGDDDVPSFHVGIEWVAVLAALAIVAVRQNLLLGLVAAVAHRGHRPGGWSGRDPGLRPPSVSRAGPRPRSR